MKTLHHILWCSVIAAICGLLLGVDSTQEILSGEAKFVVLFGSGVGIYFFSLYRMALADFFNKIHWKKSLSELWGPGSPPALFWFWR